MEFETRYLRTEPFFDIIILKTKLHTVNASYRQYFGIWLLPVTSVLSKALEPGLLLSVITGVYVSVIILFK